MKIAIDVGGVLTEYENNAGETAKPGETIESPIINVSGALDVLTKLKSQSHNLYIVSYCKEKSAIFRSNKLQRDGHSHYFDKEFYTASKYEKYYIINHIQADIMIDDNEEILNNIKKANPLVITILFQEFNDMAKGSHKKHLIANNWMEVDQIISQINPTSKLVSNQDTVEPFDLSTVYTIKNIHDKAIFLE